MTPKVSPAPLFRGGDPNTTPITQKPPSKMQGALGQGNGGLITMKSKSICIHSGVGERHRPRNAPRIVSRNQRRNHASYKCPQFRPCRADPSPSEPYQLRDNLCAWLGVIAAAPQTPAASQSAAVFDALDRNHQSLAKSKDISPHRWLSQ